MHSYPLLAPHSIDDSCPCVRLPPKRSDLPVEEPEVDLNALLPRPEPAPLRKKRWYRDEDRQLLTAWAG